MTKQEIKKRIKTTIEKSPFKDDIKKAFLFGSHASGKAKKTSDIDLLIEFTPNARIGFFKFIEIQENFERSLNKRVDLLTPEALSKYFKKEVLKKAEIVYER